jgi:hypothetical protein
MSIDCSEYDFTNNRPKTNFYNDLQELNKPVLITFLDLDLIYLYYAEKPGEILIDP